MALVVEDGTGKANAESYTSVAAFKAWADLRGFAYASYTDTAIEQSARRSTLYIDGKYRNRFPGTRVKGRSQAREWPRYVAPSVDQTNEDVPLSDWLTNLLTITSTEVPVEVIEATHQAMTRDLPSPGALSPDVTPGKVKTEVAIEGAVSVKYGSAASAVDTMRPIVTDIEEVLAPIIYPKNCFSGSVARG